MTNLFDDTARPRVAVTKLNDQGFHLSDGLIVPGGVIFVDNRIFLWDVDPPKVDKLTGRGMWDEWKEDRLSVFETVLPRPGETESQPNRSQELNSALQRFCYSAQAQP